MGPIDFRTDGISFGSSLRKVTETTRVEVTFVHLSGQTFVQRFTAGGLRGLLRDGYPEDVETIVSVQFPQVTWAAPSSDREETRRCLLSLLNADLGGK